jgi:hypothetical protein
LEIEYCPNFTLRITEYREERSFKNLIDTTPDKRFIWIRLFQHAVFTWLYETSNDKGLCAEIAKWLSRNKCYNHNCEGRGEVGAHVRLNEEKNRWFIVPPCRTCNKRSNVEWMTMTARRPVLGIPALFGLDEAGLLVLKGEL